jgi:hypothetical protein
LPPSPVRSLASHELDASTAASGPHDFAVRDRPPSSVMALASTASHRAFVTMANAPQSGETRGVMPLICPTARADYFCAKGWTGFVDLPVGLSCRTYCLHIVIASEAKQSIARRAARWLAMTAYAAITPLGSPHSPATSSPHECKRCAEAQEMKAPDAAALIRATRSCPLRSQSDRTIAPPRNDAMCRQHRTHAVQQESPYSITLSATRRQELENGSREC